MRVPGEEADAHRIAPGHEPVAVVLDLVNPVGAGRGLVGGGWQARLYEGGSTQHAAYLGGLCRESSLPRIRACSDVAASERPSPFGIPGIKS